MQESMAQGSPSRKEFNPTDDQLVQLYLYNKVHGKPLPNEATILEYDLYGDNNPWEIWDEFGDAYSYGGKDLYFFTLLKKKSNIRLDRTIGWGSWEAEDVGKTIMAHGTNQILGFKKRYRFEKSKTEQDGRWILHEYTLHSSLLTDTSANNYSLCRFRKNLRDISHKKATKTKSIVLGLKPINESVWKQMGANLVTLTPNKFGSFQFIPNPNMKNLQDNNNVLLGEGIHQGPRNHPDSGENKTKFVETTTKPETESKNKEGVSDQPMSWPELFSLQLRRSQECKVQEEKIQLVPNAFNKDLLLECIDSKYMNDK